MAIDEWKPPVTHPISMLKGIISGFLIAGGFFNPSFGPAMQIFFMALGIVVFIESIIPSTRNINVVTTTIFTFLGGLAMFILSITANAPVFIFIAAIIAVLIYLSHVITGLHILKK